MVINTGHVEEKDPNQRNISRNMKYSLEKLVHDLASTNLIMLASLPIGRDLWAVETIKCTSKRSLEVLNAKSVRFNKKILGYCWAFEMHSSEGASEIVESFCWISNRSLKGFVSWQIETKYTRKYCQSIQII